MDEAMTQPVLSSEVVEAAARAIRQFMADNWNDAAALTAIQFVNNREDLIATAALSAASEAIRQEEREKVVADQLDRVIRDGKVAVLVSPGYGAGWYSWNTECPALLFDPAIVKAIEDGDRSAAEIRASEVCSGGYFGGLNDLVVRWVPQGRVFRIDEFDGSERLVIQEDDESIVA